MASPMSWIRKYQKGLLVVFGIMLMVAFLIPQFFDFGAGSGPQRVENPTVVRWNGGKLSRLDLDLLRYRHFSTIDFLDQLREFAEKKKGGPVNIAVAPIQRIAANSSNIDPEQADAEMAVRFIYAREAEKMGLQFTEAMVDDYIDLSSGSQTLSRDELDTICRQATGGRISMKEIREHLRIELASREFVGMSQIGLQTFPNATESAQMYGRTTEEIECLVLPVRVSDQLAKVTAEPAESDLEKMFNAGRYQLPDPTGQRPGFMLPKRAVVQFAHADFETFLLNETARLTDEQVQTEYDRLVAAEDPSVMELVDDVPESGPPLEPTGGESTLPPGDGAPTPAATNPGDPVPAATSGDGKMPETTPPVTPPAAGDGGKAGEVPAVPPTEPPVVPPEKTDPPGGGGGGSAGPNASPDSGGIGSAPESTGEHSGSRPDPDMLDSVRDWPSALMREFGSVPVSWNQDPETPPATTPPATPPVTEPQTPVTGTPPVETPPAGNPNPEPTVAPPVAEMPVQQDPAAGDAVVQPPEAPALPGETQDPAVSPTVRKKSPKALKDVAEQIKRQMKAGDAVQAMQVAIEGAAQEIRDYQTDRMVWESMEGDPEQGPAPTPIQLPALAAKHGLIAGETGLVDQLALSKLEVGMQMVQLGQPGMGAQSFPVSDVVFARFNDTREFEPSMLQNLQGNVWLYWLSEKKESEAEEFAAARSRVIEAWKLQQARKIAEAEAQNTVDEINTSGVLLSQKFGAKAVQTGVFTWFVSNMFGFDFGAPIGVEMPGAEFMETAFALERDKAGWAPNRTGEILYVVQKIGTDRRSRVELTTNFISTVATDQSIPQAVVGASRNSVERVHRDFHEKLRDSLNVEWLKR